MSDELLKIFGKNLLKFRNAAGISQRELAASCEIEYADISRMENGKINASLNTIAKLAEALKCTPADLLKET